MGCGKTRLMRMERFNFLHACGCMQLQGCITSPTEFIGCVCPPTLSLGRGSAGIRLAPQPC